MMAVLNKGVERMFGLGPPSDNAGQADDDVLQ